VLPVQADRDCTASATATLDYGVVAAQMTAQASFSPANYACQDGSSGPTGGAAPSRPGKLQRQRRRHLAHLAPGTPVDVTATVRIDATGTAFGAYIPSWPRVRAERWHRAPPRHQHRSSPQVLVYGSSGKGDLVLVPGPVASTTFADRRGATVEFTGTFTGARQHGSRNGPDKPWRR